MEIPRHFVAQEGRAIAPGAAQAAAPMLTAAGVAQTVASAANQYADVQRKTEAATQYAEGIAIWQTGSANIVGDYTEREMEDYNTGELGKTHDLMKADSKRRYNNLRSASLKDASDPTARAALMKDMATLQGAAGERLRKMQRELYIDDVVTGLNERTMVMRQDGNYAGIEQQINIAYDSGAISAEQKQARIEKNQEDEATDVLFRKYATAVQGRDTDGLLWLTENLDQFDAPPDVQMKVLTQALDAIDDFNDRVDDERTRAQVSNFFTDFADIRDGKRTRTQFDAGVETARYRPGDVNTLSNTINKRLQVGIDDAQIVKVYQMRMTSAVTKADAGDFEESRQVMLSDLAAEPNMSASTFTRLSNDILALDKKLFGNWEFRAALDLGVKGITGHGVDESLETWDNQSAEREVQGEDFKIDMRQWYLANPTGDVVEQARRTWKSYQLETDATTTVGVETAAE